MGLNEPKQTPKILNLLKNDSTWAQNEPSWAHILIKFLPVMHIIVRHDTICSFSSGVINVENKEKNRFCSPFS